MGRPRSVALHDRTLADRLAHHLREDILEGRLLPGQPLREVDLAARLGCSRIPLREALKLLAGEGLVELHAYRGAVVPTVEPHEVEEQRELSVALNAVLFPRVIANLDAEAIERLEALRRELVADISGTDLVRVTRKIYDVLFACARAPLVERIIRSLNDRFMAYTRGFFERAEWREGTRKYALGIIEGFLAHDLEAVMRLMVETRTSLSSHFERHLRAALDLQAQSARSSVAKIPPLGEA